MATSARGTTRRGFLKSGPAFGGYSSISFQMQATVYNGHGR